MNSICRCLVAALLLAPVSLAQAQQDNQMLELLQQLTRLENEMRQLRGEVERLAHSERRIKNQQNDLYLDLDRRLRAIETGQAAAQPGTITLEPAPSAVIGAPAIPTTPSTAPAGQPVPTAALKTTPAAPTPVQATPLSSAPVDPAREQAEYKAAFNLLKVGKYEEAILAYSDFLRKFPGGKYAPNAQYWLGEANYVTRQFPAAIVEFRKVVSQYPQSRKLPDAMLKIGYIHYELNEPDTARQILAELIQKYPGTTAARLAENRLQRMKLEGR